MVTKVFVEWTLLKARWKFEIIMWILTKLSRWKFGIIMQILAKLLILNQSDSQWPITTSQWEFVLIARDRPQARENAFDQGAVGLVLHVIDVRAVCGVISPDKSQSMMKQRRCSLATLSTVSWKFFKFKMPLLIWQMELTEHFFDRTPSKRLWLSSLRVAGAIPGHISSNQSTYYRALLQHVGTGCEVSLRVLTL